MLGYFALLALFGLLLSACFSFGLREWLWPRDDAPVPVDVEYVRSENYFGAAFRSRICKWLETARPIQNAEAGVEILEANSGGVRIRVLPGGCVPGPQEHDDLIYGQGDLGISREYVFHQEVYALGKVRSEAGAKFQSLAADGGIDLGRQTEVTGWVDSGRAMILRRGTVVRKRASAALYIELEPGAAAESLYAPLIFTSPDGPRMESVTASGDDAGMPAATSAVEPGRNHFAESLEVSAGSRLAPDTLLISGDLELPGGQCVDGDLVVKGVLRSGAGCIFRGSVKADGVELGPFNTVLGNLVSAGELAVGENGIVRRNVIAERDILLRPGVRVGTKDQLAAVAANGSVRLAANVAVCGKIAARRAVVTI